MTVRPRHLEEENEQAVRFDAARKEAKERVTRILDLDKCRERRDEKKVIRILIAIPAHESCPSGFMYDFGNLMAYTAANLKQEVEIGLSLVQGTYVHTARQDLAKAALKQAATWVLWLDSDMRFPKELLFDLLKRRNPLVGVNYVTRTVPSNFVAIKHVGGPREDGTWDPGVRLQTTDESAGLEQVDAIGFGGLLMHTDVLYAMAENGGYPFFVNGYDFHNNRNIGEDVWFCLKAAEAGFPTFVDHDLSKQIKHIGSIEYIWQHGMDAIEEGWVSPEGHRVEDVEGGYEDPGIDITQDIGGDARGNHDIREPENFSGRLVEPIGFDCGNP
jgi:hypothetical protein